MANLYGPRIVTDGLVLYLDAANNKSYPGNGNVWYDISGNNRNYSINTNFVSWNSTTKQFDVSYNASLFNFIGPPSDSFGFNSNMEHTILCFNSVSILYSSVFFSWGASPNTGTDTRAIFTHFPWGNAFIYDVGGCCAATQRLYNSTLSSTIGTNKFFCGTWRTRTNTTPNREFFQNGVSMINSGSNSTATMTWNRSDPAGIAFRWAGKISNFLAYNRALTNEEILYNYNALKGRFGL